MSYNVNEERLLVKGSGQINCDLKVKRDTFICGKLDINNININDDLVVHGDLYVEGSTVTTNESQVSTSGDYIVTRSNITSPLSNIEYSGLIVNKYDGCKMATITADCEGIWRVSDSATSTSVVKTDISSFDGHYYDGLTQTEVEGLSGILTNANVDELGSTVLYETNYYHWDGDYWFGPVSVNLENKRLIKGSQITDASLIAILETLSFDDLIYYFSVTDNEIDATTNCALATREDSPSNKGFTYWDCTTSTLKTDNTITIFDRCLDDVNYSGIQVCQIDTKCITANSINSSCANITNGTVTDNLTVNGTICGNLCGCADRAIKDESGNNIKTSYGSSLSLSDINLKLVSKNGECLSCVDIVKTNNSISRDSYVIICSASNANDKTAELKGFVLNAGSQLTVCLLNNNSANCPTLNINNTNNVLVKLEGCQPQSGWAWNSGLYNAYYDGTYWQLVNANNYQSSSSMYSQKASCSDDSTNASFSSTVCRQTTCDNFDFDVLLSNSTTCSTSVCVSENKTLKYNPSSGVLTATCFCGNATCSTSATCANQINVGVGTADAYRTVFFADNNCANKLVSDSDFTYNPNSNTLKVGKVTIGSCPTIQYNSAIEAIEFVF